MDIEITTSRTVDCPAQPPRVIAMGELHAEQGHYPFMWIRGGSGMSTFKVSCESGLVFAISVHSVENKRAVTATLSHGGKSAKFPSNPILATSTDGVYGRIIALELVDCATLEWVPCNNDTQRFIDFCVENCSELVALAFAPSMRGKQCESE